MGASAASHMEHLEKANRVRLGRARLRREIAAGDVSASQVLLEVPAAADNWPVGQMLVAQRRWGPNRARKLLAANRIGELRPIGELTVRQRGMLAALLENQAAAGRTR